MEQSRFSWFFIVQATVPSILLANERSELKRQLPRQDCSTQCESECQLSVMSSRPLH
jgi:hypothetical protein